MHIISTYLAFVLIVTGISFAQNTAPVDTVPSALRADTLAEDTAKFFAGTPEIPADFIYQTYLAPTGFAARNAAGLSEALANNAFCQSVRYGRSSPLSKVQPYGLLIPVNTYTVNGLVPDRYAGTDKETNYWNDTIAASTDGSLVSLGRIPVARIPLMAFLWENGAFSQNYLDLRFSRMVTKSVGLGVMSHYRYLNGATFSHSNGNVADFYRTMVDSEYVVDKGRYAGVRDQSVLIRAASQSVAGLLWETEAGYRESHDELHYPSADSLGKHRFFWDAMNRYATAVSLKMDTRPPVDHVGVSGEFSYDHEITRMGPLLDRRPRYRGVNERSTFQAMPYYARKSDTLTAKVTGNRRALLPFVGAEYVVADFCGVFEYAKSLEMGMLKVALQATGGGYAYQGSRSSAYSPVLSAKANIAHENLALRIFAAQKPLNFIQPLDTTELDPKIMARSVAQAGADFQMQQNSWNVTLGFHGVADVPDDRYKLWWINGILPYQPPHSVWVIAPCVTLPAGFTLYERCLISNTRPFIKSRTVLSHKALIRQGKGSLRNDLSFEYWGPRNSNLGTYEGEEKLWLRPAMDVSLSTNVYIRSFSLYLKVDNLLNRAQAWVPGYPDPGLTFRWGFSWAIRG